MLACPDPSVYIPRTLATQLSPVFWAQIRAQNTACLGPYGSSPAALGWLLPRAERSSPMSTKGAGAPPSSPRPLPRPLRSGTACSPVSGASLLPAAAPSPSVLTRYRRLASPGLCWPSSARFSPVPPRSRCAPVLHHNRHRRGKNMSRNCPPLPFFPCSGQDG